MNKPRSEAQAYQYMRRALKKRYANTNRMIQNLKWSIDKYQTLDIGCFRDVLLERRLELSDIHRILEETKVG